MSDLITRHKKAAGIVGAIVAGAIAVIYLFIVPQEAEYANGLFWLTLTYGHTVCWLLLATASLLYGIGKPMRIISICAYAGLAIYALFVVTLIAH
jgi:hypothetical protein